ncbi:MAG: 3,4-dihydroxy-2-butanone-4-phosphate synthase [Micrococcales bacterium]|nr:3,4-dihydroxy-2-butanone-4-phosphate synthase [Micrococcales bacterium]NBR61091.1 3,4-dihydroxy-2-butanone-4-phosphate synthase [Actinomycetota bacterium]NBY43884.1 3,4-dihydroxy-2-butanone-4-phosphate synthase [Micrococcales bacterium]
MALSTIEQALDALRAGKPIFVADDEDRENEGDAIIAAQFATEELIAWMVKHTTGFLCAPMEDGRANELELPLMTNQNEDPHGTSYTVTVDAVNRESTGISAADRALTARTLASELSGSKSLIRPGHILPLRSDPHGVRGRRGHTEATVDLLKLAGLTPVGIIGEMLSDDGSMMRMPELLKTGEEQNIPVITIEQLVTHLETHNINHVHNPNNRIRFEAEANVPTIHGNFRLRGYYDIKTGAEHVAIIQGNPKGDDVLVRMHSECITGEAFGSLKCECGPQLQYALDMIEADPKGGIVIYLRGQEGRGIGLLNKLKAYALQEQGLDTVEANVALGLPSEAREYGAAVSILRELGIKSVRLMTNNPAKANFLIEDGIPVNSYVPVIVGEAIQNLGYLEAKRSKMGHLLPEYIAAMEN